MPVGEPLMCPVVEDMGISYSSRVYFESHGVCNYNVALRVDVYTAAG